MFMQSSLTEYVCLAQGESNAFRPICAGCLEVKIADSLEEIREAQALRYRVFVEEMGAHPSEEEAFQKRDFDAFDPYCDHLLVVDHAGDISRIVGTYRLLRRTSMKQLGRFYTQSEFNIEAVLNLKGEILELGRSCVDAGYRNRAVMQLLWRGIAAYVEHYRIELMFGCGSLHGAEPAGHREALSYLYHYHLAPPAFRIRALPELYVSMEMLPKESVNEKAAFAALPALIKGYLRLGGYVGDGAVIDTGYNTVDVGIIVKTELVTERYAQRYSNSPPRDIV